MFEKLFPQCYKSDGTKVPFEIGKGYSLGVATYYIDVSQPDPVSLSVHVSWDANLVATSLNYQDSNMPAYASMTLPYADKDAAVDVSIYDSTSGRWITQDPSTAYVPAGTGFTVTNMTVAIGGGTANGTVFNLGNVSTRRARIKIVVTTAGYFRCHPHGKQA